ncbi:MAG: hypothetical protein RLZZ94_750, partial [Bacteroidota bacterium]
AHASSSEPYPKNKKGILVSAIKSVNNIGEAVILLSHFIETNK